MVLENSFSQSLKVNDVHWSAAPLRISCYFFYWGTGEDLASPNQLVEEYRATVHVLRLV